MNTRTALGTCLVLTAILAGAAFLDRAQRLVPVYAAARDLPAGAALDNGDLVVVRVRLPTTALRHYLQPTPGQTVAGRVLAAPVRQETLVPAELLLASDAADQVELPVQADPGDMAQGLRPGDRVQVLAAYTEGARGDATVLLPVRPHRSGRRAGRPRPGTPGQRNQTLNRCAFKVYRYVAGGLLDDQEVTLAFTTAALAIGLNRAEISRTLTSARTAGLANPRTVPARPDPSTEEAGP
jgi:hypothetical protein